MCYRQRLLTYYMASWLAFLTAGCFSSTQKVIFEGTYNGMRYVVKARETRTYNGSRTDWRVRLGNLPELPINITLLYGTPVPLDGVATTDWGPPYDDALYGTYERVYSAEAPVYSNKGDAYDSTPDQHDYTMLYLPDGINQDAFRQYAAFMKAEWGNVDKALTATNNNFPHLIGLVNAPRQRFIRSFKGMAKGQPLVLRIDPDGYVNFGLDDGSAELDHMRHCVVQMPRKGIVLHTLYTWEVYNATKADVLTFRDFEGKSPDAWFKLED